VTATSDFPEEEDNGDEVNPDEEPANCTECTTRWTEVEHVDLN